MTGRLYPAPEDRVWAPRLTAALIAGPAAWMLRLLIGLALVPNACQAGTVWILHLLTLLFGGVAVAALVVSVRSRRAVGLLSTTAGTERTRFVALLAVAVNAAVVLAIGMEGLAVAVVDPCLK